MQRNARGDTVAQQCSCNVLGDGFPAHCSRFLQLVIGQQSLQYGHRLSLPAGCFYIWQSSAMRRNYWIANSPPEIYGACKRQLNLAWGRCRR